MISLIIVATTIILCVALYFLGKTRGPKIRITSNLLKTNIPEIDALIDDVLLSPDSNTESESEIEKLEAELGDPGAVGDPEEEEETTELNNELAYAETDMPSEPNTDLNPEPEPENDTDGAEEEETTELNDELSEDETNRVTNPEPEPQSSTQQAQAAGLYKSSNVGSTSLFR